MAKFELSNEVKPLDRIISRLAGECGYEVQQVFNDLLRYIIHGFSPGAPPLKDWKYKRQQNMAFLEMTRECNGRLPCPAGSMHSGSFTWPTVQKAGSSISASFSPRLPSAS